jgi:hypothetical protein
MYTDNDYEIFERFYDNSYQIVRRMLSYSGLNRDEMKQECAIVYFENPGIYEAFSTGDTRGALRLLSSGLKRSIKDIFDFGERIDDSARYERSKVKLEKIKNSIKEEISIEDSIIHRLEINRLMVKYGPEYVADVVEYYELGGRKYSQKYKLSEGQARVRICRKIKKIRNEIGL